MSFFSVVSAARKRASQTAEFVLSNLIHRLDFSNTNTYSGSGSTVYDLTTNNIDLSITGATFTDNHYFSFDGSNDEIGISSVPSSFQFNGTDSFSIGFWLLNKQSSSDGGAVYICCQQNYGSYPGWAIYNGGTGIRNGFRIWIQSDFSNALRLGADVSLNIDEWYYCVVTYDGSQSPSGFKFYLNGSSVSSLTAELNTGTVGTISYTDADYSLGVRGNSLYALAGLGDVHVYSDVLSASEVLSNYNSTKSTYGL